ncbi:MAG: hypothetical protein CMJ64_28635 [Planctomycetaceae bacterium]|nr:hypothetical protein [Planctomycetaceae bacterium]
MCRYYAIPRGALLAPEVDNVIAIRVQRSWFEGGIVGPVVIGDASLMELPHSPNGIGLSATSPTRIRSPRGPRHASR